MDMIELVNELSASRVALDHARNDIFKLRGKCLRKNLVIAGLVWFGYTACKMLGENEKKLKDAEDRAREAEAACAEMTAKEAKKNDTMEEKSVWCDGKVSITEKPV